MAGGGVCAYFFNNCTTYNKRDRAWYCLNDGGDGDDASDVPF